MKLPKASLAATDEGRGTPGRIEWLKPGNGTPHIEGISGDALDRGPGSERPALFAAGQKAQERCVGQ